MSQVCERCIICARARKNPPLKSISVGGPIECIGMDFKQMDVSRHGNCYALVFQNYLLKWPKAYPVLDRTVQAVARCLAEFVWRHGVPAKIIHDRAAELSDVFEGTAQIPYRN